LENQCKHPEKPGECVGVAYRYISDDSVSHSCVGNDSWVPPLLAPTVFLGPTTIVGLENNGRIVATVGEENIYQKDLDAAMGFFPSANKDNPEQLKPIVLKELIVDSILLQANKNNLPDISIINSPQKDYSQRRDLADKYRQELNKELESQSGSKEGYIISIWVMNMKIPAMGYDKAKEIVKAKINSIYDEVKSGRLTIQQAGENIKNDSSLAEIDKVYQMNAINYFKINMTNDEQCSESICSLELFPELRNLGENQMTKLYNLTRSDKEEFYAFGQVTKSTGVTDKMTYDQWLQNKEKEYDVKIYL